MVQANWGLPLFTVVVVEIVVLVMELELTTTGGTFINSLGAWCHLLDAVDEFTQVVVDEDEAGAGAIDIATVVEDVVVFEGVAVGAGAGAMRIGLGRFDEPVVVDIALDDV